MDTQRNPHRRRRPLPIAAITYALAVLLLALPTLPHLSEQMLGEDIDIWLYYWNNWWLEQAIRENHKWFYTPYMFHPQGTSLVTHANSFLNSLFALPLKPLIGPVAAYNTVVLLGLWIGAVGMFWLVYDITQHSGASFLAGFIFTFTPYHLTQALAHAHLGSIYWWPFYALFLRRALRGRNVKAAVAAGTCAALTVWSGLQLALFLALWTAVYLAWHLFQIARRRERWKQELLQVSLAAALVGGSALVLSAPVVLPVARESAQLVSDKTLVDEGAIRQTDVLAYFLPPSHHPLLGKFVADTYENFETNRTYRPYLGYTTLALAILALVAWRPSSRFWGLSALLWISLALGTVLRVNGTLHPAFPLPYRFAGDVFPISALRAPDRFNLLLVFSLPVLAGIGASRLKRKKFFLVGAILLIFFEYLFVPLPLWNSPPHSPYFERMREDPDEHGVVDYPMGYTRAKQWLYYQTRHQKPTVEGHLSRYTAQQYAFIEAQPLLRALYRVAEKPRYLPEDMIKSLDRAPAYVEALGPALRGLTAQNVRYLLLHESDTNAYLWDAFDHTLPLIPIYHDPVLSVYDLRRPQTIVYDGFPHPLTDDAALVRFDITPNESETTWNIRLVAHLNRSPAQPIPCQLTLRATDTEAASEPVLTAPTTMFPGPHHWQSGDLWVRELTLERPQDLAPGTYRWAWTCGADAYASPDFLELRPGGTSRYLRRRTDLTYGGEIRLQGYRWWTRGTDLHLKLLWEASAQPTHDYKVFVHLLDAEQEIVRQYDAIPCDWQCPTGQWEAGQVIADQARIPLWGLEPGVYHLAVGLYEPTTGERLPAQGPEGVYPAGYPRLADPFLVRPGWSR